MTFDELHRKTVYFGSAVAAAILLTLASSPHWSSASPVYAFEDVGHRACLEDLATQTLPAGPDGQPVCQNKPCSRTEHGQAPRRLPPS